MRRVTKYSPNVSPPLGDSAILSALPAIHFRVLRRRPNNAKKPRGDLPPYHQGFLTPSRKLLLSHVLLHHASPLSQQQPTQQPTGLQPTDRAQENIKELESTVTTAKAGIGELNLDIKRLKVIITCFMESIGLQRNLSDDEYADLFNGADDRINTKFVQATTTLPSFTVEKAKMEMEKTKMELEKAEAKLEKAEAKLKEAKMELKEAKMEQEKEMKYGVEDDVDAVLQQSSKLTMVCLAAGKSCDMEEYATYIIGLVRSIQVTDSGQHSICNVIRSASGVGKTFATMAFTAALRQLKCEYFPIALYCGFNSQCQLTYHEKNRLLHGEKSLRNVVMRRLLLQLNYLAAADDNLIKTMWDADTGLQRMPVPSSLNRWHDCNIHFKEAEDDNALVERIAPLLEKISKKVQLPVVLFPIVDEGQFLDEYCPVSANRKRQGARWALRLFRNIQTAMKGNHRVLGIMTGITPEVSVERTEGQISVYNKPLHSPAGFTQIVGGLLAARKLEPTQVARVSATYYPIARDVELYSSSCPPIQCSFNANGDNNRAALLILASGQNSQVKLRWTSDVPAIIDDSAPFIDNEPTNQIALFQPVLGIRHIAAVAEMMVALPAPSAVDLTKHSLYADSNQFENASWFCLSMLLVLRNFKPDPSHLHVSMVHSRIDRAVCKWLDVGTPVTVHNIVLRPENAKLVYFPSSAHHGSHVSALGIIDGQTPPPLHKAFDLEVLDMVGRTVFMSCGGDAPVDLIMITLTKAGKKKKKPSLQIRLCDAKLITSEGARDLSTMLDRFKLVKAYLEYHLSSKYTISFSPFAIVTTGATKDLQVSDKIVIISPSTCDFPPITNWWFAWAPPQST